MPQRKCAKTELKKNAKRNERNIGVKKQIKATIKKFKKSLEEGDTNARKTNLQSVYTVLDRAAARKVIHPNKAARKKSRLTQLIAQSDKQTA